MNQAVLRRPVTTREDPVLADIEAFYDGAQGLVVSIWPTPDLSARGWQLMGHPVFVVRSPAPARGPSVDATVRTVTTAEDLHAFERVMLQGYPMPPAADARPTFADDLLGTPLRLRVAEVDGIPVAAAASHIADGVVNLCMAATLPGGRRRGAWTALVSERVGDDPTLPAVAFTSDHSRPGFERMGFLPVTRFTLWVTSSG